ncbi:hypothetical protein MNBD_GAMMA08-2403 [hydrothermal vent metagenome]|uniref:Nudix hydrolase domain-containing protein n=1 Tax=hydrothermal vent metagenome TaxID=652676 RepID=A0A3B0XT02_9ZZZZ
MSNKDTNKKVNSAVAALIIKNKKILLGRRFENNQFMGWQCPGGYLQKGETVTQAVNRHCTQKAGIKIAAHRPGPYSNNIFAEHHTTTLYLVVNEFTVCNRDVFENEKKQWSWFDFDALPKTLFLPLAELLKNNKFPQL